MASIRISLRAPLRQTTCRSSFGTPAPPSRPSIPRRSQRCFSTTPRARGSNRIYTPITNPTSLSTLLLLHSNLRTPLLTFWTASWCSTCRSLLPEVQKMIEEDGYGENALAAGGGGVGFVEVRVDAPDMGDLGAKYFITSIPTLLAFCNSEEPRTGTMLVKAEEMHDREYMKMWIEEEARKAGGGGSGGGGGGKGGGGGGLFGGLFGMGGGGGS
ncbi:hypothetical protein MMC25_004970 [Agyrium rufum]|nr:hypothetical protein [Agyrium rufum]